jgi:hypothetical protein
MAPNDRSVHLKPRVPPQASPVPPAPRMVVDDEPIALVDQPGPGIIGGSGDSTAGGSSMGQPALRPAGAPAASAVRAIKSTLDIDKRKQFKRTPVNTGSGAVRCRMFHCKVAESSMEHMENQINAWLDDENIDIKHVGHLVGALEGKHTEPNVIVMIWY